MGVKGLQSFVQERLPLSQFTVPLSSLKNGAADVVVVDGMALIRRLYDQTLDWVGGGQFQELLFNVSAFVDAFRRSGLRLVVFFDGGVDDAKLEEWLSRRKRDLGNCQRVLGHLERSEPPPKAAWFPPTNISKWVAGAFADNGCPVYFTAGEADGEAVRYCRETPSAVGVLGQDSDFLVLPTPLYLVLDTLRTNDERPSVAAYPRAAVLGVFGGVASPLLPLVASLVGNDFVQGHQLGAWHSWLLAGSGRNASGAPLIEAVAAHVKKASAAAWWAGPRPTTPLLWCCLDWGGFLAAHARALVDASLAQYETGAFETERDRRFASRVSPAMLSRFKRGKLDSAVFGAAACSKSPSWWRHGWPPRAPQTASEGLGLPFAPGRRGPSGQMPPRGRGLPARGRPS